MNRIGPWLSGVATGVWLLSSGGNAKADVRFEMGARLAYGVPFGAAAATQPGEPESTERLRRILVGEIPLWLDVGARLNEQFFVGAYYQYGFGILPGEVARNCDQISSEADAAGGTSTCNGHDMRLGAEFLYHLLPKGDVDPWAGLGVGYEWIGQSVGADVQGQSFDASETAHGFEFLNLQAGFDIPATENVGIGPFLALTLAEYAHVSESCSSNIGFCEDAGLGNAHADINGKALHEWLIIGMRGTLRL
jgi:hypothetical protein